jgi:hypothetical protein
LRSSTASCAVRLRYTRIRCGNFGCSIEEDSCELAPCSLAASRGGVAGGEKNSFAVKSLSPLVALFSPQVASERKCFHERELRAPSAKRASLSTCTYSSSIYKKKKRRSRHPVRPAEVGDRRRRRPLVSTARAPPPRRSLI